MDSPGQPISVGLDEILTNPKLSQRCLNTPDGMNDCSCLIRITGALASLASFMTLATANRSDCSPLEGVSLRGPRDC